MDEKRLEWSDLLLFLAVAREGGLSPAAKITGRSPATLGRRMLALERATGRELFVRHDRGYELTADARAFIDELSVVEARINRLTARQSREKRPLVKVSAGTWTTLYLLEKIEEVVGSPPDILLRFVAAENILDISRREVVIGVRNSKPTDENLVARKLSRVEFAPYATVKAPKQWIRVLANTPSAKWVAKKVGGDAICEVNTPRNCLDLALMGKGIALLPTFIGDAQKSLQKVGASVPELAHDRWIATHQDDRHLPEVRRTIDRLYDVLD
ncbi:MAG: LysR family transcriptional regulator [Paracoccaceae bacterium]